MKSKIFIFSFCVFATNLVSCIDNWGKDKPLIQNVQKLYKGVRSNEEEIISFKQGIDNASSIFLLSFTYFSDI